MPPIAELLCEGHRRLAGISPTPWLDTELLLAHAIGQPRTHLRAWPESIPGSDQQTRFWRLVERRQRGEPVAYLLGRREFWSHEFQVGPEVLIPRPETELLLEKALALVPPDRPATLADLGTGSGAIAVSLGLERPRVSLVATDVSSAALALANANARRLGAGNVTCIQADWLAAFAPAGFDGIIANPPYISTHDPHLAQDIRFEPASALLGGCDGLAAFRQIIPQARRCLKPGGFILLEHGCDQSVQVAGLLNDAGFRHILCHFDLQNHPRVTQAQWSP